MGQFPQKKLKIGGPQLRTPPVFSIFLQKRAKACRGGILSRKKPGFRVPVKCGKKNGKK
jgi:hypothetical protein